jgi:hypothetical protein
MNFCQVLYNTIAKIFIIGPFELLNVWTNHSFVLDLICVKLSGFVLNL